MRLALVIAILAALTFAVRADSILAVQYGNNMLYIPGGMVGQNAYLLGIP